LARLMPNIGGATQLKWKLLGTVVHNQLLYAEPIYGHTSWYSNETKHNIEATENHHLKNRYGIWSISISHRYSPDTVASESM